MPDSILVTGAAGLVGTATVRHLTDQGRHVVGTDLAGARPADLTDPEQVRQLLDEVKPTAIVHLAAVIPPLCYKNPALAHKVNVGATRNLVDAAAAQTNPPRFVQASSIAVYGPRNPYRITELLTAETPVNPYDIYGQHKVEAEQIVRESNLDWVILRLGGVLSVDLGSLPMSTDMTYFESVLPIDGRLQTVDVRDVAHAFAAATTADVVGRTLLIGGDDSHRQRQSDIASATAAAMGLVGGIPPGRPGDPDSDDAWFATDWMDTATAQELLKHQHHSWPDMLAEISRDAGWKRYPLRLVAPLAREFLKRQSAYYRQPGRYASPWDAVRRKWGHAEADRRTG